MENIKTVFCAALGAFGSVICAALDGSGAALCALVIFMTLDYVSGIAAAALFGTSNKSETGTLNSRAGFRGLCRKGMMLAIILISGMLDASSGAHYVRDSVTIAFSVNEVLSIIENAALCGVPIPDALRNALEVMKKGGGNNANK